MAEPIPIAVVGLACRFPGAPGLDAYWSNILGDVCSIAPMPRSRFNRARYFDPEVGAYGKSYCELGGLIEEHPFDAAAFRMPPKVVESTDVAHLWALEVARAALEDAGYEPFGLSGANVGVIVGHARGSMLTGDIAYGTAIEGLVEALDDAPTLAALGAPRLAELKREIVRRVHARYPHRTEDGSVGTMTSALAGLIAGGFGFTGRHMVVDAACASSFAALEIAVNALQQGRLDGALVGGASYSQELSVIMFAQSRALSPDGSFPFDARANGFISSDGFGLLLLRRLDDALRDGNKIRAVIRGLGGSCDGKGKALWAPRKEGQILAIQRAYQASGVDPASIELIEAHATSTPLGDRTELEALEACFAEARGRRPLPVGSVKGNIGHCREAAGAAGLVKAILALEHQVLPPTGNFRSPSPEIPWGELSSEVVTAPRRWESRGVRRAGVNAFGIGGLNYHVIVEEAPPERRVFATSARPQLAAPPAPIRAACDIAVVGVGGRFPGAASVERFWEALKSAADLTSEVPPERWSKAIYFQPGDRAPYRTYLARGAFISDFEADWRRYKIPPKLVERNDPLQFMLLESASDALADAKIELEQIDRQRVAVLVGSVFGSDYALNLSLAIRAQELAEDAAEVLGRAGDGGLLREVLEACRARLPSINEDSSGSFSSSTLASRTSKTLDLMGPAYALDAACASSLASLEAACELLRSGEVDLALYGGGDRAMRVQRFEAYCQFYAVSRGGTPRPFDAEADGFLPGEGAGVVLLERLEDAERLGHPIYAVIRGVGSSSDGEKKSLYRPSAAGLARAMGRALEQAGLPPEEVTFVECHGGATPLGDATEVAAVREVYGQARAAPLLLGSVKSNVGHTQGAAGVMGLIKVALALKHGEVPPTRGFRRPHPEHRLDEKLRVTAALEPLPEAPGATRRAAAISSMGLAGINYHAVLERPAAPRPERRREAELTAPPREAWAGSTTPRPERRPEADLAAPSSEASQHPAAPQPERRREASQHPAAPQPQRRREVFSLAAASLEALVGLAERTPAAALHGAGHLGEGPARATFAALDVDDLARGLAVLVKTRGAAATAELREKQGVFVLGSPAERAAGSTCFAFSGQGSQYPGMMKALAEASPAAAAMAARIDAWLTARDLPAATALLYSGAPLPYELFPVQLAVLTGDLMAHAALVERGITPDVVTGHSYGDYAALVAAGAWSVEDALAATRLRAEAIAAAGARGGMLSVTAALAQVEPLLAEARAAGPVWPANVNAPDQVVLAGADEGLVAAEAVLRRAGLETTRLQVPGPFHSPLMGGARPKLEAGLAQLPLRSPAIRYLSSVTGRFEDDPEAIRRALAEQLLVRVDFVSQVERLLEAGAGTFIECGPKAVLTGLVRRITRGRTVAVAASDDAQRPGAFALARVEAMLAAHRDAPTTKDDTSAMSSEPPPPAPALPDSPTASSLIPLLEGEAAEKLLADQGFGPFWEKTRPSLITFLESLWTAEKRFSQLPAPAEATTALPEPLEAEEPSTVPVATREEVQAFLLEAICKESGYPPEIIELDADLEADLGIDTVKQAQVLGKVRDHFDIRTDEKLSLRDFPSLRHILDYVEKQLAAHQARPAKPRRKVPMLDVTERRTRRPGPAEGTAAPASASPPPPASASPPPPASAPPPPPASASPPPPASAPPPSVAATPAPPPARPVEAAEPAPIRYDLPEPGVRLPPGASRPVAVLHLRGTARELGQQLGEALRDPILEVMERYQDFLASRGMLAPLPGLTELLSQRFDAASLEELGGIADALGVPPAYLYAYNLDAALFPSLTGGCTQTVRLAEHNDGALIHAVNEDSPLLLHLGGVYPRVVQVRQRTDGPQPDRRVVFFSLAGQVAGPNGVADHGLSLTSTTLLDAPEPKHLPEGLPHPILVKRVLEEATSFEDALRLIRGAPKTGRWSVLLSDADRDRAHYLEYDHQQLLVDEAVDVRRTSANHSVSGPATGGVVPEHSAFRAERACALVDAEGPLTVERAKAILRDRRDLGRARDVTHPTMNTVRRVDNVMSLIIEPRARRLHVSDRVLPPGSTEEVQFISLGYGRASPRGPGGGLEPKGKGPALSVVPSPGEGAAGRSSVIPLFSGGAGSARREVGPHLELLASATGDLPRELELEPVERVFGAGLAEVPEVMRRQVIRAISGEPSPPPIRRFAPRRVLLSGAGPHAEALAERLRSRGAEVHLAPSASAALVRLAALGGPSEIDALGVVLPEAPTPPWSLEHDVWRARRGVVLSGPFALLRAWAPHRAQGTAFALTFLGGAFGFDNAAQGSGDHGGLVGLLKAVRREFQGLEALVVDTSPSEPPGDVADLLLAELDAGASRLEGGLLPGKRVQLAMADRAAPAPRPSVRLPRRWVVTGGARGVTAAMAERLAQLYQPELHLLGRQPLPPPGLLAAWRQLDAAGLDALKQSFLAELKASGQPFSPLAWKARTDELDKVLEIDRNLRALEAAGSRVHYHPVDLADRTALARALDAVRAEGPIGGLLHGAGVEVAKAFDKKTDELFEATAGGKVDGFVHLLALTEHDPLTHVVSFSSVSGRFGGHGQTDYALANEALARLTSAHAAARPDRRVFAVSWAAFAEVGLAARSSAKAFLERAGQAFMSPAEGANHLIRELWGEAGEVEVTISADLEALDLDRLQVFGAHRPVFAAVEAQAARAPLLDHTITHRGERLLVERRLEAREPFLDQHRMGPTPILPAVIGLELFAEAASLDDEGPWAIAELVIERPLKVPEGGVVEVRVERTDDRLRLSATTRKPDGVVLEPDRTFMRARRVPWRMPAAAPIATPSPEALLPYPYPRGPDRAPGSRAIYHGPVFRTLEGVLPEQDGGRALLLVPPPELLVPGSDPSAWRVPAALLDGCLQAAGMLGRLLYGAVALPAGFERVDVAPRALLAAGERAVLQVRFRERGEERLVSDLSVISAAGPLLEVRGYQAQVVPIA